MEAKMLARWRLARDLSGAWQVQIFRSAKLAARATIGVIVTAMLLGTLIGSIAHAQDGPAQRAQDPNTDPRYKAPIGARQPRPQDLPPGVLRDEGHVTPSERDFDKNLQISRPC
jgi:hypothetical protein